MVHAEAYTTNEVFNDAHTHLRDPFYQAMYRMTARYLTKHKLVTALADCREQFIKELNLVLLYDQDGVNK